MLQELGTAQAWVASELVRGGSIHVRGNVIHLNIPELSLWKCSQGWRQKGRSKCKRFVNFWSVEHILCYKWPLADYFCSASCYFLATLLFVYATNKSHLFLSGFLCRSETVKWKKDNSASWNMTVYLHKLTESLVMVLYILSYIRQLRIILYCMSALRSWH